MTIIFKVTQDEEGYSAKADGLPIFTQGDDFNELRANTIEALQCHFDDQFRGTMDMVLTEKIG